MGKLIVIDFDYEKNIDKSIIEDIGNVKYVNYYEAISNLNKLSMVEFNPGCSYDSVIIINPDISKLSRFSRLISINIIEDLILDHLFEEKGILVDFRRITSSLRRINSNFLRIKVSQIIKDLKSLGVIDIAEVINKKSQNCKIVSQKNYNIFITEKDICDLNNGGELILDSNEKLTPLAKDYIKAHNINIIRKSVGE